MNSKCIEDITRQEGEINRAINRIEQITNDLKKLLEFNDESLALIYKAKNEEFSCLVQYEIILQIFTHQIKNKVRICFINRYILSVRNVNIFPRQGPY